MKYKHVKLNKVRLKFNMTEISCKTDQSPQVRFVESILLSVSFLPFMYPPVWMCQVRQIDLIRLTFIFSNFR